MGFTRYWERPKVLERHRWDVFVGCVWQLCIYVQPNVMLGGWDGTGVAEFGPDKLYFNGEGKRSGATFLLSQDLVNPYPPNRQGRYVQHCKTDRKPYDIMVAGCLLLLKLLFSREVVIAVGEIESWDEAIELVNRAHVLHTRASRACITGEPEGRGAIRPRGRAWSLRWIERWIWEVSLQSERHGVTVYRVAARSEGEATVLAKKQARTTQPTASRWRQRCDVVSVCATGIVVEGKGGVFF